MRSSPEKLQEWRDRLKRFRESGLTQREFCVLEQQSEKQFYYWARKLNRRSDLRALARIRHFVAISTIITTYPPQKY